MPGPARQRRLRLPQPGLGAVQRHLQSPSELRSGVLLPVEEIGYRQNISGDCLALDVTKYSMTRTVIVDAVRRDLRQVRAVTQISETVSASMRFTLIQDVGALDEAAIQRTPCQSRSAAET